ncbi:hypothetical protein BDA99DRAFT_564729 [Phascolomyces articulosus]|uniref:Uncharacterized protein n=1 Tax=Phascolomyces articulosus TaxID=60185 RepID=A0AAD5JPZ7_9FUNG|nr:hypothetical protein BDA99DRAFT_564729 [Phascolomyces articulosus]
MSYHLGHSRNTHFPYPTPHHHTNSRPTQDQSNTTPRPPPVYSDWHMKFDFYNMTEEPEFLSLLATDLEITQDLHTVESNHEHDPVEEKCHTEFVARFEQMKQGLQVLESKEYNPGCFIGY